MKGGNIYVLEAEVFMLALNGWGVYVMMMGMRIPTYVRSMNLDPGVGSGMHQMKLH